MGKKALAEFLDALLKLSGKVCQSLGLPSGHVVQLQ